ncbi:MAG: helix-turn-helix domain-containing protein [Paracoccaceae bacterium]
MIVSQQQYNATRKKLKMLEESLSAPRREGVPEKFVQAALGQTRELMAELQAEIDEYDRITTSSQAEVPVNSIEDLLLAPIRCRLASHMSTEAFARTVGVSARQIFRYEQENYRNCSLANLTKILGKLNVKVSGSIALDE